MPDRPENSSGVSALIVVWQDLRGTRKKVRFVPPAISPQWVGEYQRKENYGLT